MTEEADKVKVIVELPGVDKQDIDLRSEDRELTISVDTERKRFCKQLELPCDVLEDSAVAEYRNGVLTVFMDKVEPRRKGRRSTSNELGPGPPPFFTNPYIEAVANYRMCSETSSSGRCGSFCSVLASTLHCP